MKQDWTPTPWEFRDDSVEECPSFFSISSIPEGGAGYGDIAYLSLRKPHTGANARRIVAAVNATSALSTESLEAGAVGKMAEALLAVIDATRDYLPPDGISKDECIGRILQATDNAELFHIIRELERK
jgi:hypothetical protein